MIKLGYPTTEELIKTRLEHYSTYPNKHLYVAVSDNIVVGVVCFTINSYFHRDSKFARITALAVDKKYRNKKIGQALLNYV